MPRRPEGGNKTINDLLLCVGSATAVLCRIIVLPGMSDPFSTIAAIAPFIFLGGFYMSQRRTAMAATDASLFYLFVTQPGVSIAVIPVDLVLGAVAMVAGVGVAWLSYRFLIPINPTIRLRSLMASNLRDVEMMAAGASPVAVEKAAARLRHRVIRMIAMATRHDAGHRRLVAAGIVALALTDCIKRLKAALASGDLPPSKKTIIEETLMSLNEVSSRRGDVTVVLERAAAALYEVSAPASSPAARGRSGFGTPVEECWDGGPLQCPI